MVRLYLRDRGVERVRALAGSSVALASAWHGQTEVLAALHRAFRLGRLQQDGYQSALGQFINDSNDGLFHWLPLTDALTHRLETFYRKAGREIFLRAADALHLACAVEHGFKDVYSNDRHFLAAAQHFGMRGRDVIPA